MADVVLLDTSIVSVLLKVAKVHDERRVDIDAAIRGKVPSISFVTVAELNFWAESRQWQERRRSDLSDRLRLCEILDPTITTCEIWARTKYACSSAGISIASNDLWIASSAIEHGLPLYSLDGDFSRIPSVRSVRLV